MGVGQNTEFGTQIGGEMKEVSTVKSLNMVDKDTQWELVPKFGLKVPTDVSTEPETVASYETADDWLSSIGAQTEK